MISRISQRLKQLIKMWTNVSNKKHKIDPILSLERIIREDQQDKAVAILNGTISEVLAECKKYLIVSAPVTQVKIDKSIQANDHEMFLCIDPVLNVSDYVQRLAQHTGASVSAILLCSGLLRRLLRAWMAGDAKATLHIPRLSKDNVHKVVLAAFVTAIKITDDDHRNQAWLSECGGISTEDLFSLEISVLQGLDYRLILDLGHVQ